MTFDEKQISKLKAKLHPKNVSTRKSWGGDPELSYIAGWWAIAEANRIFGFDGWTRETVLLERLNVSPYSNNGKEMAEVNYMAKVRVEAGGVFREGIGFGNGQGKAGRLGAAYELAIKEAETDAMKRALMTFGNPFGLALYDKTQKGVGGPSKDTFARELFTEMQKEIDACEDEVTLRLLIKSDEWIENIDKTPVDWKDLLVKRYNDVLKDIQKNQGE